VAAEFNAIRIGILTPTTDYPNVHTQTFIASIANANVTGSAVFFDSNGQLKKWCQAKISPISATEFHPLPLGILQIGEIFA
jgi:hypothetical protein